MKFEGTRCDECGTIIDSKNGITIKSFIYTPGDKNHSLINSGVTDGVMPTVDLCVACLCKAFTKEFRENMLEHLTPGIRGLDR